MTGIMLRELVADLVLRSQRAVARRVPTLGLVMLLATAHAAVASPAQRGPAAQAAVLAESVVTVRTPASVGSGVVIDPSGVIVTNLHVIRGETEVTIAFANGDAYDDVAVIDVDERRDLVLLKIKAFGLPAIPMANSDTVRVGDRVVLIGSPRGLERTVSEGLVSAIRDSGRGFRLFQTDAAASQGSSGGPMLNESGELVGIVTLKLASGENLNFAVPINYARGMFSTEPRSTLTELADRFPADPEPGGRRLTSGAGATTDDVTHQRLAELVAESSLAFERLTEEMWWVTFRGEALPSVDVSVLAFGGNVLVLSYPSEEPELTPGQMQALLRLNYDLNYAKVSVDGDGDLVALTELDVRTLDSIRLDEAVRAVAWAADSAAGILTEGASPVVPEETRSSLRAPRGRGLERLEVLPNRASLVYASREWSLMSRDDLGKSEPGEFRTGLAHSSGEVWFMVLAERVELPLDLLPGTGLAYMRETDPNARVTRRGSRSVSGLDMLFQEIEATVGRIPLTYYVHYFSSSAGTFQLLGWTTRNLIEERRKTIEAAVAGFRLEN